MTEATDRSRDAEDAVPSTAPAPAVTETYQPLSLLALAGFALAVLYALVVVGGGFIALLSRVPWLMPGWSFLLPLAALLVCWAARSRILASENTLSGLAFTTWGFRLTIVLGLTYAAYYGATYFTVRHQAIAYADSVLNALKNGQTEQSFLLAVGVLKKEELKEEEGKEEESQEGKSKKEQRKKELRELLEVKYNTPMGPPGTPGPYTRYRQSEFVRMIEYSPTETQIVPMGVVNWEYTSVAGEGRKGYRVILRYHVSCPLEDFDLNVETFGPDSKPGEKGRQWQIALDKSAIQVVEETRRQTPLGKQKLRQANIAQGFATRWTEEVNRQQWLEAFKDTLPPSERTRWQNGQKTARFLALAPLAGAAVFGLYDADCRDFLASARTLDASKLIQLDKNTFWTGKKQREQILQRIEHTFQPSPPGKPNVTLRLQQAIPRMSESDGQITLAFELGINYMGENPMQIDYLVEGRLIVAADSREAESSSSAWRIVAIEMETGRTPTPREGQGPRRPNAPRAGGPPG